MSLIFEKSELEIDEIESKPKIFSSSRNPTGAAPERDSQPRCTVWNTFLYIPFDFWNFFLMIDRVWQWFPARFFVWCVSAVLLTAYSGFCSYALMRLSWSLENILETIFQLWFTTGNRRGPFFLRSSVPTSSFCTPTNFAFSKSQFVAPKTDLVRSHRRSDWQKKSSETQLDDANFTGK